MKQHVVPNLNTAIYVGIDIHPSTHTAFAINRFEEAKGHLRFENTKQGIKNFLEWLEGIETNAENVIIGVEGRGGNGQALVSQLLDTYVNVYEVNPLYTKHRRTYGTKGEKTDVIDARLIAEISLIPTNEVRIGRTRKRLKGRQVAQSSHVPTRKDESKRRLASTRRITDMGHG